MSDDNYFNELNQLQNELKRLDERGLILSLAAFSEDCLSNLLKAYMFDNIATAKLVDGFNAPLGTLSAKIKAAYALGLITKSQYNDFESLRAIRNMFSHTWQSISFEDEKVKKYVNALSYSNVIESFPETPREKIQGTLSFLLVEITSVSNQISKTAKRFPLGSRLFSGLTGTSEEQLAECKRKCENIKNELLTAAGERQKFYTHLRRIWIERYYRVVAKSPKEKEVENLADLLTYTTIEELKFSNLYWKDV